MSTETRHPLGYIVGFRGLRGEFRVRLDNPSEPWHANLQRIYLQPNPKAAITEYQVETATPTGASLLLSLKAFPSRTEAEPLLGSLVLLAAQDIPPRLPNEYTIDELTDLTLIDAQTGQTTGLVKGVLFSGAQVFLELVFTEPRPGTMTVPFQTHFFPLVDLNARTLHVQGLDGLW